MKGMGQAEEHRWRTHGHGQWEQLTVGVGGDRVGVSNGEKGRTTVT